MNNELNFLIYNTPEENISINAVVKEETIWLTQKAMSELFGVGVSAISKHLKNIFEEGELEEKVVISILETVASGCNSPSEKILERCFEIAGTSTSNNSDIAFCVSHIVSSLTTALIDIFSSGVL